MKETQRISKLFQDLYDGNPWIDITIVNTLQGISAAQAAKKVDPDLNSIWQIVHHIISWRENVLRRVQGEVIKTPGNNYFIEIKDTSAKEWKFILQKLEDSQQKWIDFLKKFNKKDFDTIYPVNETSYYDHIHGIIQHDAYHLGQIVLLAKMVK